MTPRLTRPYGGRLPASSSGGVVVRSLSVLVTLMALAASQLAAQEAAVRDAVTGTLAAWTEGDFDRFADYYHPDVRGFFFDGGPVQQGFDVATLQVAYESGLRTDMQIRDLQVTVVGDAAVSVAYLDGSISLPGGMPPISGTWRYSETRVSVDGVWKVVQYHFSQLGAGM